MIAHRSRHADTANGTHRFQPSGDVHAVAMQVGPVCYHVANVDADAEADAPVGGLVPIIHRDLLLDFYRAAHCAIDAVERNQQQIAAGLHHSAAVLADRRVD